MLPRYFPQEKPVTIPYPSLSTLLRKYNLHPRKGLGQNFLTDPIHLEKIVEAADLAADEVVLEIGPGPGTLTRLLAERAGQVIAVELDPAMVNLLRQEYGHLENLTVVEADILDTNLASLISQSPDLTVSPSPTYKVVANLPYYITSAVMRHLLESRPAPTRLVVMVQKEVAQRMVAEPGKMSLLAVSVQFYGRPVLVHHVPAGAFFPPPKVDSAVVRLDTFAEPPIPVTDVEYFFRVVKAGFGQKRKQLKNALTAGLPQASADILAALAQAGIDPTRRAETLSLEEWGRLAAAIK
ncbi:MAG: ribosomal RNA small subunit methyltransferase A [Anaerolineae bacterium]|nr:ribosomal RNA small subunit methyltransferase A [Anaerolineae bacterium]